MIENPTKITDIKGRQIIDSRGNPTVEAEITLACGAIGVASVPSGASTGIHEAHELRDKDKKEFLGRGVTAAVENINHHIAENIKSLDAGNQIFLDSLLLSLDGTKNKSHLGANAILAVSLAAAKAAAIAYGLPLYRYIGGLYSNLLPLPMMNILNGGAHAANNVDIQEFMIMPVGAHTFPEAIRWCVEIFHNLGGLLKEKGMSTSVGDEGGFAPNLSDDEEAISLILQAVERAGYRPGEDIRIALDAASSEWCKSSPTGETQYVLPKKKKTFAPDELTAYWETLCKKYPIASIEDGAGEEDWETWTFLTEKLGRQVQLVGDDLFVTNASRLKHGIKRHAANAILVKVNQIGTLSETLHAIQTAQRNGYASIISHRSGETEDTTIADLAVAVCAGQIKTGAPSRTDRVAKYNRLLRIQDELGSIALFKGGSVLPV